VEEVFTASCKNWFENVSPAKEVSKMAVPDDFRITLKEKTGVFENSMVYSGSTGPVGGLLIVRGTSNRFVPSVN